VSSRNKAGTNGNNAGSSLDTESSTTNAIGNSQVLLEGQVFVDRYEGVKLCRSKRKQLAVLNTGPPSLHDRSNRVVGQRSTQPTRGRLIKP
jgi:hypothetical protein